MKLLIVTNYLGNKGGLGRYSKEVHKALSKLPIEIKVASEENILLPVFKKGKFTIIKNIFINILRIRKYAKEVDVVHAHDGWPYGIYAYFAVIFTRKKLYITGVGTYTIAPLTKGIRSFITRLAYSRAHAIFCISDYIKNRLLELHPSINAITVFMGTTEMSVPSKDILINNMKSLGVVNYSPIFLTVGDIKQRKGQLDSLKAITLLKNKYPRFKYVMIGNGDDEYYVNQIKSFARINGIEDNVLIISNMYDDSILATLYASCDIFMLNSNNDGNHFEGFGLVLLEAAQFGRPVIGSKNCGIENALRNCYNGFLTRQGDHKDISSKIEKILRYKKDSFGNNSEEFYKNFSWTKTADTYFRHYSK